MDEENLDPDEMHEDELQDPTSALLDAINSAQLSCEDIRALTEEILAGSTQERRAEQQEQIKKLSHILDAIDETANSLAHTSFRGRLAAERLNVALGRYDCEPEYQPLQASISRFFSALGLVDSCSARLDCLHTQFRLTARTLYQK